jgi:tyrosine-protein kinase Etk/Wzc
MIITQHEPKSAVSEAFRALRTSLHFSGINKENKIILITSSFPQEGKSIVSSNLSSVIAQTKARVLIIDCDLRRSSLHEKFGHSKTPGLSEILTGDITFAKAIHDTGIDGLDLISAGTNPPNPSELLGSEAMRQLITTQRKNYDYIVIDAPPVMAVSDAPVLTSVCDLVVLVVEAGRVPIKIAQRMREMLSTIKAPVAGIVFNDKSGKGETYEYYGSRYYGKGYGYGYYSDENGNGKNKSSIIKKLLPEKKKSKKT